MFTHFVFLHARMGVLHAFQAFFVLYANGFPTKSTEDLTVGHAVRATNVCFFQLLFVLIFVL